MDIGHDEATNDEKEIYTMSTPVKKSLENWLIEVLIRGKNIAVKKNNCDRCQCA